MEADEEEGEDERKIEIGKERKSEIEIQNAQMQEKNENLAENECRKNVPQSHEERNVPQIPILERIRVDIDVQPIEIVASQSVIIGTYIRYSLNLPKYFF